MGAHSSKEKLSRSYSERYIHSQMIERERFGSFGKRTKGLTKGKCSDKLMEREKGKEIAKWRMSLGEWQWVCVWIVNRAHPHQVKIEQTKLLHKLRK